MTRTTRRSVLVAVGVGLTTAGCVSTSGSPSPTEKSTTSRPPTEATTTDSTTADETTASSDDSTTAPDGSTTASDDSTTAPDDSTATDDDSATTDDWIAQASKEPEPDHQITVNNEAAEARTVRVRVVRNATDEAVFEETREIPGGTEIESYNLKRANPEGVEAFTVCGELVEQTEAVTTTNGESETRDCVTLHTNECHGNAHVTVREDGSLRIIYAIC